MTKIIKASGNDVEPFWPMLFAKALKGQDVGALLANVGTAAAGAGPAVAADAGAGDAPAEKEEEKKKDEPEDVDMGGLFGDDDDY